jgi:hypothetical protein
MRTTLVCSHPECHSGRKRGRNSFRSVKKTVTATGQARFDAEHDEKFGHADSEPMKYTFAKLPLLSMLRTGAVG